MDLIEIPILRKKKISICVAKKIFLVLNITIILYNILKIKKKTNYEQLCSAKLFGW